jgi:hypothetical protein
MTAKELQELQTLFPKTFKSSPSNNTWRTTNKIARASASRDSSTEHSFPELQMQLNAALTTHLTPHTSHLTPHTSHLTPHTSHLTPHTSHLTPHTSQFALHSPLSLYTTHVTRHNDTLTLLLNSDVPNQRHCTKLTDSQLLFDSAATERR